MAKVFYFGNVTSDFGNRAGDAMINAMDMLVSRANTSGSVAIDNAYDYNHDKKVDSDDITSRSEFTE